MTTCPVMSVLLPGSISANCVNRLLTYDPPARQRRGRRLRRPNSRRLRRRREPRRRRRRRTPLDLQRRRGRRNTTGRRSRLCRSLDPRPPCHRPPNRRLRHRRLNSVVPPAPPAPPTPPRRPIRTHFRRMLCHRRRRRGTGARAAAAAGDEKEYICRPLEPAPAPTALWPPPKRIPSSLRSPWQTSGHTKSALKPALHRGIVYVKETSYCGSAEWPARLQLRPQPSSPSPEVHRSRLVARSKEVRGLRSSSRPYPAIGKLEMCFLHLEQI